MAGLPPPLPHPLFKMGGEPAPYQPPSQNRLQREALRQRSAPSLGNSLQGMNASLPGCPPQGYWDTAGIAQAAFGQK